jgi:hypothetical protein
MTCEGTVFVESPLTYAAELNGDSLLLTTDDDLHPVRRRRGKRRRGRRDFI